MDNNWQTRQTLLQRAKDPEDHKAWSEFVDYYREFIAATLGYIGVESQYHDDITQETLIQIWQALPQFEMHSKRAQFRTWFSRIIRNVIYKHTNKEWNVDKKHAHYAEKTASQWETASDTEFEKIINEEWQVYLGNMAMKNIEKLFSGKAIRVFQMSLDEKSIEEISAELGIAVSSVYKLKGRVRDRLVEEITHLRRELEM